MSELKDKRVGGSSTSTAVEPERRWSERRFLAFLIRLIAFLVPLTASLIMTWIAGSLIPSPPGLILSAIRLVVLMVLSIITYSIVARQSRRLLPLSALFKMSMVFPDHVPSRFSVALRTGTARQLERTLATLSDDEDPPAPAEAAALLLGLVKQLTEHDRLTRGHSERVRVYSDLIAEELDLEEDERDRLHWSALLHDIGKLRVPAKVLNKPGRPNEEEWEQIRGHPGASLQFLSGLEDWLGEWILAASQHHERWDGDGYPNGLAGEEISLAGRIVGVADAYDVMTSARSYKKPLSAEAAREELVRNSGTQFDPMVVRAFLNIGLERTRRVGGVLGAAVELPGIFSTFATGVPQVASTAAVMTAVAVSSVALPIIVADAEPVRASAIEAKLMQPGFLDGLDISAVTVPVTPITHSDPTGSAPGTTTSTTSTSTSTSSTSTSTTLPDTTTTTEPEPPTTTPTVAPPPPTTTTTTTTTTAPTIAPSPWTVDDFAATNPGGIVLIDVLANDTPPATIDGTSLTVLSFPSHGTVEVTGGNKLHYRADNEFLGSVNLVYLVCDVEANCWTATAYITIE